MVTAGNLHCLRHDEYDEGEAQADDEDTGYYQVSQQPAIQGHRGLEGNRLDQ